MPIWGCILIETMGYEAAAIQQILQLLHFGIRKILEAPSVTNFLSRRLIQWRNANQGLSQAKVRRIVFLVLVDCPFRPIQA